MSLSYDPLPLALPSSLPPSLPSFLPPSRRGRACGQRTCRSRGGDGRVSDTFRKGRGGKEGGRPGKGKEDIAEAGLERKREGGRAFGASPKTTAFVPSLITGTRPPSPPSLPLSLPPSLPHRARLLR